MISKKICLVGDFAVGKTSLIRRFVDKQFSDEYLSTVGVKISKKQVKTLNDKTIQLLIWDIEGQTKFKGISPSYLQGASGAILVADVTRPETVSNLEDHITLFMAKNPKGLIVIAFNKTDLVSPEKIEKLKLSTSFSDHPQVLTSYATSAKTGKDVDEIFQKLTSQMVAET